MNLIFIHNKNTDCKVLHDVSMDNFTDMPGADTYDSISCALAAIEGHSEVLVIITYDDFRKDFLPFISYIHAYRIPCIIRVSEGFKKEFGWEKDCPFHINFPTNKEETHHAIAHCLNEMVLRRAMEIVPELIPVIPRIHDLMNSILMKDKDNNWLLEFKTDISHVAGTRNGSFSFMDDKSKHSSLLKLDDMMVLLEEFGVIEVHTSFLVIESKIKRHFFKKGHKIELLNGLIIPIAKSRVKDVVPGIKAFLKHRDGKKD